MKKIIFKKETLFILIAIGVGFAGASFVFKLVTKPSQVKSTKVEESPSLDKSVIPPVPLVEPPPLELRKEPLEKEAKDSVPEEVESEEFIDDSVTEEVILEEEKVVPKPPKLPDLILSGIFFEERSESYVLINNRILREGDLVKGVKIVRILSDSVKMELDGYPFVLKIR